MRSFFVSLTSEFYKSRKTLAFWSAILLPLVICILMSWGFISQATKLAHNPAPMLWFRYISAIVGVMGVLLLPVLVIYNTYAITNMEYKGDTWKSLFSLPLPKLSIYASKYVYIVFLTFITMLLFGVFIILTGHGIQLIKPELKFGDYNANNIIFRFFSKLFLSAIGIISIQFLMNLMWNDFLKPFGIGFLLTIMGIITANVNWKYVDYLPYAYPNLTVTNIMHTKGDFNKMIIFDQAIYNSLICGVVVFIIGYFLVAKKTIK
ncbi:ABC transporter permease [Pedobacter sp. LMG 31464]|uniref:ABC transporter permease n=1 Tax=Pedobacter planticolens TaxID=2679964 RepID=A0A923E1A3_9SPHI|nr:ABC transporter permease [Pedobacter planticolens]MBB2146558.1 ABC transporter permease [Pedobacter planticolens]